MSDEPQTSIFRKESLERLSSPEQLDQLMQVVNSRSWLPLATLGSLVMFALIWSIFGRIPISVTGRGVLVHPTRSSHELVSLTYFDQRESERIQPGMGIIILPDTIDSEQVGGILGRVKTISEPPVTTLNAARQAGTTSATALQATSIEVLAELERDSSTASGYRWSSVGGQRSQVSPGTPTTVRLTLEERSPISFVFPFLRASQ